MYMLDYKDKYFKDTFPLWIKIALLVCACSYVFEGLLRWLLSLINMGFLIYIRDPLVIIMIVRPVLRFLTGRKVNATGILLWIYFGFLFFYSVFTESIIQVFFGVKILLLFILGVAYSRDFAECAIHWRRVFYIVSFMIFVGLVIDSTLGFPWRNMVINVGGHEKAIGKTAQVLGERMRHHGFSLAPNPAASYSIIFYLLYSCSYAKWSFAKLLLLIMTFIAIWLTGIRSILLALMIISLCDIFRFLPYVWDKIIVCATTIFVALGVGLPFILSFGSVSYSGYIKNLLNSPFASFAIRIMDTWPHAFAINKSYLLGGGLGAVGGSQIMFDPWSHLGGGFCDNWAVYAFLIGGITPIILFSIVFVQAARVKCTESYLIPTLSVFIAVYGSMETGFELPGSSFFLGILLGYVCMRSMQSKR